jgi:hypothetical protein
MAATHEWDVISVTYGKRRRARSDWLLMLARTITEGDDVDKSCSLLGPWSIPLIDRRSSGA